MVKCRLCLKSSKELRSIFDKEDEVLYIDMITSISNIKIKNDEQITGLCPRCSKKLKEAFDFKNMIEMSNLIFNKDNKKVYFNNFDEIKVKPEIDMKQEICENNTINNVLENMFSDENPLFFYKNTTIKKVESKKCTSASEDKAVNIYDYIRTFKSEPNDDGLDQDYDPYDNYDITDDEYVPPKCGNKKRKAIKGKENKGANRKENKVAMTKKHKNDVQKVRIKPVFLDDIAIVRTKIVRTKQQKIKKKQMCNFCGKMTSSIKSHVLIHIGKKTHKCDRCGKSYYSEANLRSHTIKHDMERKYKCDQCVAKFLDLGALSRHMMVHNDEKQYTCPICNKSFKRKSAMLRHVRFHNSANKNIKCDQCEMTFFSNSSLRHHVRVHTGERPYRCEMCSQSYSYKHDFNRHCFKKHGVFLKRRKVAIMNENVLAKEQELMRALMLRLRGVVQGEDPFKEFEGPQGYKALEQAINLLESKQLPVA